MRKENVKVLQIERWNVMFNVDVTEWQNGFAGTQSSSLIFWDFKSYKVWL